jgi:hypothetical protein
MQKNQPSSEIFDSYLKKSFSIGYNQEKSNRVFVDIINILDKNSVLYWCCFGTLLGIIRDNKLIHYDRDIDIGILNNDEEKILGIIDDFTEQGFEFIRYQEKTIFSFWRDGIYVDLYVFTKTDNCYRCARTDYRIKETSLKIKNHQFLDITVKILDNPEKCLEQWYGDWKTPKACVYDGIKKIKDYSAKPVTV